MGELKITQLLTPMNKTVRNDTGRIKYIVIHYVGALGGAEANCKYYAEASRGASAHYFVGHSGEIFQSVPDGDVAWHCGAKSYKHPECRNTNSVGIELCVRKRSTATMGAEDKDWYFEDATVAAAAELTRSLMEKYNVPADHVIQHYDVTGKICPNPFVYDDKAWITFQQSLAEQKPQPEQQQQPEQQLQPEQKPQPEQNVSYEILTTCDALNIRGGAGTDYPITGAIRETAANKKQHTVTEEQNGWGRLKNGAGWISLKYTKKGEEKQTSDKKQGAPYSITTTCDVLNIRAGAGANYPITGAIRETAANKKQYTITEEQNGWGRLKSGAGWISLAYAKKI